ncbi:MAG: Gfo/Idh/MocA family oxidoreductase, partial [Singulisphaera sp.]
MRRTARLRSPLKVCVIGYGGIGPDHIDAYEQNGAQVAAVSDVRPSALAAALDRGTSVRAYRDYRRMLAEIRPEIVSVCTWAQSHTEFVVGAARAGVKGVLCEK